MTLHLANYLMNIYLYLEEYVVSSSKENLLQQFVWKNSRYLCSERRATLINKFKI